MPTFELDRLLSYDDQSLLDELRRVAALVNSPFLTKRDFDKSSRVCSGTVRQRFGGWQQALVKAGLENRYSQSADALSTIRRRYSDDEILEELRSVSKKINGAPLTSDVFNDHAQMNADTIRRRFGGWSKALERARLTVPNRCKRYSDEDYFENLLTVWTQHGRQPKYYEMNAPPSSIPISAYEHKWGGWRKALSAFLDRVNSDVSVQETKGPSLVAEKSRSTSPRLRPNRKRKVKQDDLRQIRLGLRYEVMKRDRFRCVLCGANPATLPGCVLHVDHVLAWSRGGKTTAENLRTLCANCNLGKSNKLDEPAIDQNSDS